MKTLGASGSRIGRRAACLTGVCLALLVIFLVAPRAGANEVEMIVGNAAPDFSLMDQDGTTHSLADYRKHWVVLYFYPKDDTPGCTTEACNFRDDFISVQQLGAEILGVSIDSRESHARFSTKHKLPFPLLADTGGRVARQYGALSGMWPLRFASRHTFLIDPQGRIAKIYRKVDPKTHSREVIADLKALQQAAAGGK
jgi:peroxiredoxin Q/BCP